MAKRSKRKKGTSTAAKSVSTDQDIEKASVPWLTHDWILALILVGAVLLAYQPVWHAGFIWDDDANISANPCLVGPLGLKEIWTTSAGWYFPLTLTTFWLEHALWGLAPSPYHLVNIFLQGISAVLLWQVLRSLLIPGAWLGAALWALHPVQVESVAWITETKNTQSAIFYLLAILFFVRGMKIRDRLKPTNFDRYDTLTLLFSILALASKTSTVVLPLVLCLCAWWSEGHWNWRTLARTGPIFLVSILASAATLWSVKINASGDHSLAVRGWPERLAGAGDAFWFYLGKLAWPYHLTFIYPRWEINPAHVPSYVPLLAAILVFVVLWVYRASWARPYFLALTYFAIALLPVLGLLDQYFWRYSFVGDHFQYLASMGPLALLGAGLARFSSFAFATEPRLQACLCAALLIILGSLSWQQAWAYENEETLWTDTLAKNPGCALASNNLGNILARKGKPTEAITLFQQGLKFNPHSADLCNSLGNALLQNGQIDSAIEQYHKALEIDPANFGTYNNLGFAYAQSGNTNEAILQYEQALQINPRYADAHNNLGSTLLQNGQLDDALAQFQKALEINPRYTDALNNLGWTLLQKGQTDDAIIQFHTALDIDPNNLKAHNNLGIALAQTGHLEAAISEFQADLRLNPNDTNAQRNLSRAQAMLLQGTPAN